MLSIKSLSSLDSLGTLSIIAGAILSNNAEIMQALAANRFGINNFYINFSKEQEREADHYAVETLKKLNLSKKPLIELLNTLEEESLKKGLDKLVLNKQVIDADLERNWAVIAEAIQTILRREGYANPYETLRDLTRINSNINAKSIAKRIKGMKAADNLIAFLLLF